MRELTLYRIMMGKLKCTLFDKFGKEYKLILVEPSIDTLYEAQIIYEDSLKEALAEEVYDEKEYFKFLIENKYWTLDEEKEFEKIPTQIEDLKVDLYNAFAKSNTRKMIKAEIEGRRKRYNILLDKRHKYDYLSAHGIASMAKTYYLTACTSIIDNSPYKIQYEDSNLILDNILSYKTKFRIDEKTLRDLARNDPWRSYWSCGNVFGKPAIELTEDQRNLLLVSKMYDNVGQSSEAPHDSVIDDDDMLDGWIIKQRRKRQAEQAKVEGEGHLGERVAQSATIFLPAETEEDIKRINDMNSPAAQMIKTQRMLELNKKGEMKEEEFFDQRVKILNQLSQKG